MARRKTSRKQVNARETRNTFIVLGIVLLALAIAAIHQGLPTVLAHVR